MYEICHLTVKNITKIHLKYKYKKNIYKINKKMLSFKIKFIKYVYILYKINDKFVPQDNKTFHLYFIYHKNKINLHNKKNHSYYFNFDILINVK